MTNIQAAEKAVTYFKTSAHYHEAAKQGWTLAFAPDNARGPVVVHGYVGFDGVAMRDVEAWRIVLTSSTEAGLTATGLLFLHSPAELLHMTEELSRLNAETISANTVTIGTLTQAIEEELYYLRFFYQNADFGPAHGDVVASINEDYRAQGGVVPAGYEEF